uniref:Uncharacterized protein n=1 Tax=Siphoviridae sp. ct4fm14 TaxID=2825331 RepID=A0A8S5UT02_9CAUD|nr:MAG TPA: hypothetical protein [Siphoviridae sp. ct4fm14]
MLVTASTHRRTRPHRTGNNAPCAALCVTISFRTRLVRMRSPVRIWSAAP